MKAIILAAGRGSRMGPITEETPKRLIPLQGKTLLEWQLEALANAGIKEIGIVTGYLAEKIKVQKIKYFVNKRWSKTSMVASLLCADEWLQSDTCVVSYSDIVYPTLTVFSLSKTEGDLVISYNTDWLALWKARFGDPLVDSETFKVNDKGILLEILGEDKKKSKYQD